MTAQDSKSDLPLPISKTTLVFVVLITGIFGTVLIDRFVQESRAGDGSATIIEPTEDDSFGGRVLDAADMPSIYTGEVVDIDGDERPDVALFGAPTSPVLRPLVEDEGVDWSTFVLAGLTGLGVILAAALGPFVGAWAKARFGGTAGATD